MTNDRATEQKESTRESRRCLSFSVSFSRSLFARARQRRLLRAPGEPRKPEKRTLRERNTRKRKVGGGDAQSRRAFGVDGFGEKQKKNESSLTSPPRPARRTPVSSSDVMRDAVTSRDAKRAEYRETKKGEEVGASLSFSLAFFFGDEKASADLFHFQRTEKKQKQTFRDLSFFHLLFFHPFFSLPFLPTNIPAQVCPEEIAFPVVRCRESPKKERERTIRSVDAFGNPRRSSIRASLCPSLPPPSLSLSQPPSSPSKPHKKKTT